MNGTKSTVLSCTWLPKNFQDFCHRGHLVQKNHMNMVSCLGHLSSPKHMQGPIHLLGLWIPPTYLCLAFAQFHFKLMDPRGIVRGVIGAPAFPGLNNPPHWTQHSPSVALFYVAYTLHSNAPIMEKHTVDLIIVLYSGIILYIEHPQWFLQYQTYWGVVYIQSTTPILVVYFKGYDYLYPCVTTIIIKASNTYPQK